MSNDPQNWMTAGDAATVLKVSQRQVHYYASAGKIRTRRQGRRVLFNSADVAALADELSVDLRPAPPPPRDLTPVTDLVTVLQERGKRDDERYQEIDKRLGNIEERLPSRRLLQTIVILLVLVLIALLVFLMRPFLGF